MCIRKRNRLEQKKPVFSPKIGFMLLVSPRYAAALDIRPSAKGTMQGGRFIERGSTEAQERN